MPKASVSATEAYGMNEQDLAIRESRTSALSNSTLDLSFAIDKNAAHFDLSNISKDVSIGYGEESPIFVDVPKLYQNTSKEEVVQPS